MSNDELVKRIEKLLEPINQRLDTLGQGQKIMNRKLTRVQKDISLLIKTYDKHVIHLRRRIARLEEHSGLSQPS